MTKSYASKATAIRGAKRAGMEHFRVVEKNGRFELHKRSAIVSPVQVVWDICIQHGKDLTRKELIAKAMDAGVTRNTAKTQYQRWAKCS